MCRLEEGPEGEYVRREVSQCIKFNSGGRESSRCNCGGLIGWGVWAVGCAKFIVSRGVVDNY